MKKKNKIILAYSGGLDTSVILKWLQINYDAEVITYTADIGQGEELSPARKKAKLLGVKNIIIEDLKEEFAKNYVYPMLRANAVYEGRYLLGTSIARPVNSPTSVAQSSMSHRLFASFLPSSMLVHRVEQIFQSRV